MTTTVTVEAHVSSNKKVVVHIEDKGQIVEEIVLLDGETAVRHAYDDRKISVQEMLC